MGTRYTTNTTSGYNATPPADDGSTTEANKVKWSTIKTKLADPVKDLADTINTDLFNHFDRGPDTHSANYTTVASDYNTVLEVSGTTTITLGDAATMTAGYFVTIANIDSGTVTVALDTAADTLAGTANGTYLMGKDQAITFIVNAGADGYLVAGGTAGEVVYIVSNDGDGTGDPILVLRRNSASPAATDILGMLQFDGQDSAGNSELYARIYAVIEDPTTTSEDGSLTFQTKVAGTNASRLILGAGLYTAGATGGDQGADTVNSTDYYVKGDRATVYCGYVDASGTSEILPAGWSAVRNSVGSYQITHNLGLATPASDLIITATAFVDDVNCSMGTLNTNDFGIVCFNLGSTAANPALEDTEFHFIAVHRE